MFLIRHRTSVVDSVPDSMGSLDPDPRGQKWPRKKWKQLINFIFWSDGCSSFDGWKLLLELKHSLWRLFLQFLRKKISGVFFSNFGYQNPGSAFGTGSISGSVYVCGSGFTWIAGSGSGSNESVSTTLSELIFLDQKFEFYLVTHCL